MVALTVRYLEIIYNFFGKSFFDPKLQVNFLYKINKYTPMFKGWNLKVFIFANSKVDANSKLQLDINLFEEIY